MLTVATKNVIPGSTTSLAATLTFGSKNPNFTSYSSYTFNQPVTLGLDGTVTIGGILLGTATIGEGGVLP